MFILDGAGADFQTSFSSIKFWQTDNRRGSYYEQKTGAAISFYCSVVALAGAVHTVCTVPAASTATVYTVKQNLSAVKWRKVLCMLCKVKGKIRPYPVQCSVAGKIVHENMIRYQWQSWEGIGQTGHCQQMPPFMSYFWFGKYGGIYEYIHIKNYTNEYPNIFSWIMNHNMIMIILNI